MGEIKTSILRSICYTELVYGRITKKLNINLSKKQIEDLIYKIVEATDDKFFSKEGKNYHILSIKNGIKITINSNTYRVITVDRVGTN